MAKLTKPARDRISPTKFAFSKQRKEPLENASHVRNAVARFNQVKGVTDAERRAAWKRIRSAAKPVRSGNRRVRLARMRHVACYDERSLLKADSPLCFKSAWDF
jgi:hypothetical protein